MSATGIFVVTAGLGLVVVFKVTGTMTIPGGLVGLGLGDAGLGGEGFGTLGRFARRLAMPAAAALVADCFGRCARREASPTAAEEAAGRFVGVGVGASFLLEVGFFIGDGLLIVVFLTVGTGCALIGFAALMLLSGIDRRLIEGASGRPSAGLMPADSGVAEA